MITKLLHYIIILLVALLTGCVNSPDSIEDKKEKDLRFEYTEVRDFGALKTFEDGDILIKLDLKVQDKAFSCYGRVSSTFADNLSEENIVHKIELDKNDEGYLIIDSIQSGMGLYGGSQYWVAFSWLSALLPYVVAHTVSLIVPVIVFFIILLFGFVFVEF
jgi:hypothetical protein